jgi:uncharacterized integral membrane protein
MRAIKIILAVVVLLLVFLLIRQNIDVLNQQCQFRLNLWVHQFTSVSHPFWVIILFVLFVGILGTGLYSLTAVLRLRQTNRQLHHDLMILKNELEVCRPLIKDTAETTATPASPNP